jgi:hypothetical protein
MTLSAADVGFPYCFQLSEYECSWTEGPRDNETTGGFVRVRVARTGDDTQDWIESDKQAATITEAMDIARALIAEI